MNLHPFSPGIYGVVIPKSFVNNHLLLFYDKNDLSKEKVNLRVILFFKPIMIENLWLIPLGFATGILGSIIGLGGAIIAVPVMTFAGFPPTLAASNSLFAVFTNAVASTSIYAKQKRIEYGIGLKLGLMCIPGTILGAFVSDIMTPAIFQIIFAVILISSAVYIIVKRKMSEKPYNLKNSMMIFTAGASFFAGIISGLFGIGGGVIFVPLMVIGIGISMRKAAPTSQLVLIFASLSGLIVHSLLGHPDFIQAMLLSIGAFGGGLLGARLSLDIKETKLKILVTIVLMVAAVKLIIDSMEVPF